MRRLFLIALLLSCCGVLSSDAQSRLVTQPTPLRNAAADGVTKGVVTFTAADFNCTAGLCSIDYTNAQAASGSVKGFLTAADWTKFNAIKRSCQPGFGDGLNAIASGIYPLYGCENDFGSTWTITRIACKADAAGATADVKNGAGTSLLTGAITCGTGSFTNGTQSGTTTISASDVVDATLVSNGTPKKIHVVITGTF